MFDVPSKSVETYRDRQLRRDDMDEVNLPPQAVTASQWAGVEQTDTP